MRLKVIECVPEDGRIVFSERAAQAEAGRRRELFDTLVVGQQVTGEVTNITDFGVFIDLGGVEGLIHISELSWGRVAHPSQIVSLGQSLKVQVLDVSPERCRVALSLKRLFENPWESAGEVYRIGQVVPATITSIVSYGAFARLEEGLEGLIHSSEMPLEDEQVVKDLLIEGQEVQVRVLHIDAEHQRLGLSLKILE
jgi:small subunit ribosomal protein S1